LLEVAQKLAGSEPKCAHARRALGLADREVSGRFPVRFAKVTVKLLIQRQTKGHVTCVSALAEKRDFAKNYATSVAAVDIEDQSTLLSNWSMRSLSESRRNRMAFVEAGKPRTAHLALQPILQSLIGELRICDPYYGCGSLLRLDGITDRPIRFLTHTPDKVELNQGLLPKAIAEFTTEHPNVEFRKCVGNDVHDRFVVCPTDLILLGHGLKDVGNKDSFVVRLGREIAADTIDQVIQAFDAKWVKASAIC
jgi:hypothetical protein